MKNQEQVVVVREIEYRLKPDGTAVVEKDTGSPWVGRDIRIPEYIQEHKVVSIADGAFSCRNNLASLFVPATVTWIGNNALPQGRWEKVLIGYQEEYGWYRKGSFPMYGNEIVPIVRVVSGSYAERYCKEQNIKYVALTSGNHFELGYV